MYFSQQGPACHANHGVFWNAPAQLFYDLESHGFRPLGIVGAEIDIDESPTVFSCDFRAEAIHLVIRPLNSDYICAEYKRAKNFARLKIRRNQDEAAQ